MDRMSDKSTSDPLMSVDERPDTITVQFSHPADDSPVAAALRAEGITPLLVNGAWVAGTTEDHLQQALDAMKPAGWGRELTPRVFAALADAIAADPDEANPDDAVRFAEDAVLLLAAGLAAHGRTDADALPFCAVRFCEASLETPELHLRKGQAMH